MFHRMLRPAGLLVLMLCVLSGAGLAQSSETDNHRELRKQVRKLLKVAAASFENGQLDSAATIFDSVKTIEPGNPDAAYYLARISLARGDTVACMEQLEQAVIDSPRSFRLKKFLAGMYLSTNRPDEALKQAENVLKIRMRDSEALYLKGRSLLMSGDSARAVEVLEQALEIIEKRGRL